MNVLYRGAEAEIVKSVWLGIPCVIKRRVKKDYRHPDIDEKIRKERLKNEAKMIIKARSAVKTPHVLDINEESYELVLEYIEGEKVKELLEKQKNVEMFGKLMGEAVRKLHENGIIHNDLTTSNFLFDGERLWLIDFGLAERSQRLEDKATDLVVFKRMLKASHWDVFDDVWRGFLEGYNADKKILSKVDEIEKRAKYMR